MVTLEVLLADEQTEAVNASPGHDVRDLVNHQHLSRAKLVLDVGGRRANHCSPSLAKNTRPSRVRDHERMHGERMMVAGT